MRIGCIHVFHEYWNCATSTWLCIVDLVSVDLLMMVLVSSSTACFDWRSVFCDPSVMLLLATCNDPEVWGLFDETSSMYPIACFYYVFHLLLLLE